MMMHKFNVPLPKLISCYIDVDLLLDRRRNIKRKTGETFFLQKNDNYKKIQG